MFATKTVLMHQKATGAGFDTIDEYLHETDPSHPFAISEVESAHALGMDVDAPTVVGSGLTARRGPVRFARFV